MPAFRRFKNFEGFAFFLTLALCLTAVWWFEGIQTNTVLGRSLIIRVLRYFGDAIILMLPFPLLKARYRWTALIPVYVATLWTIGSLWYHRFWGDLPGISSFFLVSNLGTELFRSVLALWKPVDFLILLLPLIVNLAYVFGWKRSVKSLSLNFRDKTLWSAACFLSFLFGQFIASYVSFKYYNSVGMKMSIAGATKYRLQMPMVTNQHDLSKNGPIVHIFKSTDSAIRVLFLKKELTESDSREIEDFIMHSPEFPQLPDSIIEANRNKNIIIIIVESLNAEAIYASVGGKPVAPVMQSLIEREGSISALNIVTQVRAGGSGDGQLISNTGLHPLPDFSAPIAVGSTNTFPALPLVLGKKENVVIFSEEAKSWNERNTFTSYGFDTIYCRLDYPELIRENGCDGGLFNFASQLIPSLQQPFLLELLTVSMHTPFDDLEIPDSKRPQLPATKPGELSDIARSYFSMVNYFDTELGLFIDRLENAGILDNTLLVIMSDHSQEVVSADNADAAQTEIPMALIISNSGITRKVSNTVGQVDIYPTILNITGSVGPKGWRGAGTSILTPGLNAAATPFDVTGECDSITALRLNRAKDISKLILRTDYFAK